VAEGKGPDTKVRETMSPEVKYCFEDDDLDEESDDDDVDDLDDDDLDDDEDGDAEEDDQDGSAPLD